MTKVLSDRPISAPEDDKFGRKNFAEAVAAALVLPEGAPSIVMAIEGEWGSGKTSVLNMVSSYLSRLDPKPLMVPVDSWLISGSGSVVSAFLVQLATALGADDKARNARETAERVLKLARFFTPVKLIPGVGTYAGMAQEVLQSVAEGAKAYADLADLDIQKKKLEVAKSIQALGRPVVVIIDDLDRLEPEETRSVFRLVKAVADFERVSYLLSYDPEPVHRALSYDGVYNGISYLEKIVQVAYPLPQPGYWALKRYLQERLEDVLAPFTLEEFEKADLSKLLAGGGLGHALRYPRDVNRLVNRLGISVPATRGEVNVADVVAFEALSVIYPRVAAAIRKRPYEFVGGWLHHDEPLGVDYIDQLSSGREGREKRDVADASKPLWEELPIEQQRPLKAILDFIFPGAAGNYVEYTSTEKLERELKISRRNPLLRLLAIGPVDDIYSAREAMEFLEEPEKRKTLIKEVYESDDVSYGWLSFVLQFRERARVRDLEQLISVLLNEAAEIARTKKRAGGLIDEMSSFILHLMQALPEESASALLSLAGDDRCLSLTHDVVLQIAREHGLWPLKEPFDINRIIKDTSVAAGAVSSWLAAVRRKAEFTQDFLREPKILDVLFRWGQLGDQAEVQSFVENLTSSNDGVERFLSLWAPGHLFNGLEWLFHDWRVFRARCETHPRKENFREDLWAYFEVLERGSVEEP